MRDVQHAFAVLRDLTKLPNLELDQNHCAEIIFDGVTVVVLVGIDPVQIELSSLLKNIDVLDEKALKCALTANCFGNATGAARLALHPDTGRLLICERIDVTSMDAKSLEQRLLGFLNYVDFWNSEAGRSSLSRGERHVTNDSIADLDQLIIRI